jgi:ABC-type multidrug transport system ATPase subunit
MGPSGSGKTTLLDVLAGRKTAGKTTGTLLFSGAKPSRAFLRRFTGYVEQFDTLLPVLTVEEMLLVRSLVTSIAACCLHALTPPIPLLAVHG